MPSRISGSESTSTCAYRSRPIASSAATALAEKPHCGARGSPFMNSTTELAASNASMRARRAGSSDMAGPGACVGAAILRPVAARPPRLRHDPPMDPAPTALHQPPRRPHAWAWALVASQLAVALLWWRFGWRLGLPLLLASHLVFVWGTLRPRSALFGPVLWRLPTREPVVWLTIDDGPSDDTP